MYFAFMDDSARRKEVPRNALIRHARALGERTAAELKERWRALKRVIPSPSRIGAIARATLVSIANGSGLHSENLTGWPPFFLKPGGRAG
jgi:hypothetical protein